MFLILILSYIAFIFFAPFRATDEFASRTCAQTRALVARYPHNLSGARGHETRTPAVLYQLKKPDPPTGVSQHAIDTTDHSSHCTFTKMSSHVTGREKTARCAHLLVKHTESRNPVSRRTGGAGGTSSSLTVKVQPKVLHPMWATLRSWSPLRLSTPSRSWPRKVVCQLAYIVGRTAEGLT